ncbi:D-glycero-beta-D-manno-heptose 1-phosphate adenylyltransferase [Microbacterium horticulturae]|uniref:Bifunctional protein HldE n=1 Tax=Microbacterium horticulturae TaxID=3028316 RepID=A0ABY8C4D3_9MICO|nr:D-glycero-beta-D-manno-heptose 1-phosphate adenylyltransferase [Microbacterium sp. KACC 23027]WEG09498.1 D-glycero-beta-D-manno-heptose 1-phosphate adenylyltransferase [Microbacterium sp. KACC 23027]
MTEEVDAAARRIRDAKPRVTVLGTCILDRWTSGDVHRVSREAPVPVIEMRKVQSTAGGAANTALNAAALGAQVRLLGVVGDDADGKRLRDVLRAGGVDVTGLVSAPGATTISKTRVIGNDQILARLDTAGVPRPSDAVVRRWVRTLGALRRDDTLIVCDYSREMLSDEFIAALAASRPRCRIIVDAHDLGRWRAVQPDIVTPSAEEVERLLGDELPGPDRAAAVGKLAGHILHAAGASSAVVTLDHDGAVSLPHDGGAPHRTVAHPAPESQATGAGDTFAAALAVAGAVGTRLAEAADFAQHAADVVIARTGTAVCRLGDLLPHARSPQHGVVDDVSLRERLDEERSLGKTIVFTNGCFDILHPGHTAYLEQARALGDVLVVGVNDDDSVRRLKGPERPINAVEDRARVLAALGCVDYVVVFSEDTPMRLLSLLRPHLYVKGGDYTPEMLDETPVVDAYGGEVRTLGYFPGHSTTALVDKLSHRVDGAG